MSLSVERVIDSRILAYCKLSKSHRAQVSALLKDIMRKEHLSAEEIMADTQIEKILQEPRMPIRRKAESVLANLKRRQSPTSAAMEDRWQRGLDALRRPAEVSPASHKPLFRRLRCALGEAYPWQRTLSTRAAALACGLTRRQIHLPGC